MDERSKQQSKPEFEQHGDSYVVEKGSRFLTVTPKEGEFEVHVTRLEIQHHWDNDIGQHIPEPEDVQLHHSRQPNVEGVAEVAQPFGFKLPEDLSKELAERQHDQRQIEPELLDQREKELEARAQAEYARNHDIPDYEDYLDHYERALGIRGDDDSYSRGRR